MPIRVLVVDDPAVVRQGSRMFLSLDPSWRGWLRRQMGRRLTRDVVLMDLIMPGMDGISLNGSGTG